MLFIYSCKRINNQKYKKKSCISRKNELIMSLNILQTSLIINKIKQRLVFRSSYLLFLKLLEKFRGKMFFASTKKEQIQDDCSFFQKKILIGNILMSIIHNKNLLLMIFRKDLLKDKVAIVSGGATGICLDISRALLENGASVHIISRKIQNINNAVKLLKQETGNSRISGSSCDVRDEKQIEKTVTELVEAKGRIDILVNGAAGNFICPFEKLSPNAFRTVLMIDTVGTFLLSKYVNQIGFKNGGVIVNISANLHVNGTVLQSHAGTAKAGVDALTKHMAVELGPKGVRVVGISPGIIEGTEGFSRLNVGNQSSTSMSSLVPSQRLGTARDIANCTIFLCSDGASYINGQTITVDGGSHLTMANFPFFVEEFRKSYGKPKL